MTNMKKLVGALMSVLALTVALPAMATVTASSSLSTMTPAQIKNAQVRECVKTAQHVYADSNTAAMNTRRAAYKAAEAKRSAEIKAAKGDKKLLNQSYKTYLQALKEANSQYDTAHKDAGVKYQSDIKACYK